MITFPKTIDEAVAAKGELRAGATELHERRAQRLASGSLVDLRDLKDLAGITWSGGKARIGATTTLAAVAADSRLASAYPGLTASAGALATPQIRAVGTLAGNLVQRSRCWYFRSPEASCLKKGGDRCYARTGDHLFHSCFDLGPCIAVHPSTMAMTLMVYDAEVELAVAGSRKTITVAELMGDGGDPTRENALPDGAIVTAVLMPAPVGRERASYFRAISRARAEWPLVEATARLVLDGDRITLARVAIGGVAPVPLRREATERALEGQRIDPDTLARAAELAAEDADPQPGTEYKVGLVAGTVLEVLERASHGTPSPETETEAETETKAETESETEPESGAAPTGDAAGE